MKFTLAATTRYWWPVTALVPDDNNPGKFVEQTLKMMFEPKSQDELLEEQRRISAIKDIAKQAIAERKSLAELCKGWDDVLDSMGKPMPFTPEDLDAALQIAWFRAGVWRAYHESQNGQEARLGN